MTKAEPGLSHFVPGYVHASKREIDCTDRDAFRYYDEPDNRSRLAALSVLYTWAGATDHQFIYKKQMPHLVFSVDHGHFFFGTAWTEASLGSAAPATRLDPSFDIVNLTSAEIAPVLDALGAVTVLDITSAVARSPAAWPVTVEERVATCKFLDRRRAELLALRGKI